MFRRNTILFFTLTRFEAKRFKAYPVEIAALLSRRIIELALYITFWLIVSNHSNSSVNPHDIISYYLIVTGIAGVLFTQLGVSSTIIKSIKYGTLNQELIKPIPALLAPFSVRYGRNLVSTYWCIMQIVVGIVLAGAIGGASWLLLPVVLFNAIVANIGLNILVGTLGFYFIDAGNIKNVATHIISICGGLLIPLALMPHKLAVGLQIFTPFPAAQYQLAVFLQGKYPLNTWLVLWGTLWALATFFGALRLWNYSLKHYDAVGA